MLFNSVIYFVFLTIAVLVYWRLPWRQQNLFLLGASYVFYGYWDWRFLSLMLMSTLVDFFCAKIISKSDDQVKRRSLLTLSLVLNFGFLGFFKYFNFFIDSAAMVLSTAGVSVPVQLLQIVLPPGISFYTFQAVAYIVDVYYKKLEPAENLVDYALFISFFPHLIAGPIQRPSHLLPQCQKPRHFDAGWFCDGLLLIASGLFRKLVIADNCGAIANAAFDGHLGSNAAVMLLGVYAFAWQIYGDFSSYSDFARGSAQLMGFHFMVNFKQPYLSTSLQEFWRRWHISLSTWLRDYLYIGLGGNRLGTARTYYNLMVTMLLGGLWHGANWTFVVWGAIHGVGLAIERFVTNGKPQPSSTALGRIGQRLFIFHIVCLSWVFFRASSVTAAFHFLGGLKTFVWKPQYAQPWILLSALVITMLLVDLLLEKTKEEYPFALQGNWRRVSAALAMLVLALVFSASESNAFIYFQF